MKPLKIRAYWVLLQMLVLLGLAGGLLFFYREQTVHFFRTTQTDMTGIVLNALIFGLFVLGLVRVMVLYFSYATEQRALNRFILRMHDRVANPTYQLPPSSLVVERYRAAQLISQQQGDIDQSALAATTAATQSSRFTLIRFVHNTLILSGVFGTIVSLSMALVGASGLLNSPESLENMSTIIGGMSTALSTTITAIVCYVFYTYYHLRLQDARTRLLAALEQVTTLYILPQFRSVEGNMLHDVAALTRDLRTAAESVAQVQNRFLQAGERLQLAVDDLQSHIGQGSEDIRLISDLLREGFRLGQSPTSLPTGPKLRTPTETELTTR